MNAQTSKELELPSLPDTVRECLSQLYSADADFGRIALILQKDPGLVSSILKIANSVAYSSGKSTSDLKTGMTRIGMTSVVQVLVSQSIEHIFQFEPIHFFNMKAFTKHSAWVSQLAFEIGKQTNATNLTDLLVAGLMHDIGLLVRIYNDKTLVKMIVEKCVSDKIDFYAAERLLKLEGHEMLGFEILTKWKLPEEVILFVRYHHTQENFRPKNLSTSQNKCMNILCLSDIIAHRFGKTFLNYSRETRVNKLELEKIGLTSVDIEKIIKIASIQLQNY